MFGILNINKPPGVTSRDVVNRIQGCVQNEKIGHAGTLDPLATGVLVVCTGPATRLVEYVQQYPKRYRATFVLGRYSDTEDIEGEVTHMMNAPVIERHQIEELLPQFIGAIRQRPPAYSAIKVNGERSYRLARRGDQVELPPRLVQIYEIRLLEFEYPRMILDIRCGSGTYVRSLGRDIGLALQTRAVMENLTRTAIGPFGIEDSVRVDLLDKNTIGEFVLPPRLAVRDLPAVVLNEGEVDRISLGQRITNRFAVKDQELAAIDRSGNLIAVLQTRSETDLSPKRNFVAAVESRDCEFRQV